MVSSTRLTDDILIVIFTYLPLYSIYKLKCLSKVWLSNLSNPSFIIKWFQINKKSLPWIQYHTIPYHYADKNPLKFKTAYPKSHSVFISKNEHLISLKFLVNDKRKPFQRAEGYLLGSSNGLVLFYSLYSDGQRRYHVCNPLTQRRVSLPFPPPLPASKFDIWGIFCENSSSSFATCYKVVRISKNDNFSKKFNVDIFSSDLGEWENFQVSCDEYVRWNQDVNIVILNGVLFWIQRRDKLLVYNLSQKNGSEGHQCSLINLPNEEFDDEEDWNPDCRIGESQGWVCFARIKLTSGKLSVSVWVLDEVNWQLFHKDISVDNILAELRSRTGDQYATIEVLGFSPVDGNVVLLGWKQWVWAMNIQTRSVEELCLDSRHLHESLDNRYVDDASRRTFPFVLTPMATVLPLPYWKVAFAF